MIRRDPRGARWIVLRHAWPVRWAHHPLCRRHRHETWRIGRLFLCRGCACLAAGLLAGAILAWAAVPGWCAALAGLLPIVLILSWPPRYARLPRPLRDGLRVGLGLSIVGLAALLVLHPLVAWPVPLLMLAIWSKYTRVRARVQARRCDGCPELGAGICSGYRRHARAARAISAELEARLEAAWVADPAAPGRRRD